MAPEPTVFATTFERVSGLWTSRVVLVTGGCGFIGSHLVEALLAANATVRVLDAYNSSSSKGHLEGVDHANLTVSLGDVADPFFVRELAEGADTIFHLAALIGIPYSYSAPAHYVATNIGGTLSVLEAARNLGTRRVVHTSTSETYGSAQYTPIDERHPAVGQSPYAATKIGADQLAISYFRSFDTPVTVCRPFNTFGPRQSLRAIVPTLMAQALFADVIELGDGSPIRDLNYVADTVSGFLALAEADEVEGEVFNIGSGIGRKIRDVVDVVQDSAGTRKPVRADPERLRPSKSEVTELVCDYSRATSAFGYKPTTDFRVGVDRVRDYLLSHRPRDVHRYHV